MFNAKVFSITVPKEVEKNVVIEPLQKNEKREMNLISDSIYAWGDSMEIVHIPSDIIKIESDSVIINALALQNLRGLQFQIVAMDNPNDRALITVYVSSDATKYAEQKMEQSKPQFVLPWISEDQAIQINLPEETPLEHTLIHLPAFNPETGEIINNITLKGAMAEYFTYDTSKSSLVVAKLIDYEVLDLSQKIFDLEIIADNPSSPPTSANLIVTVQNLDDNSPKILFFNNENAEKPLKLKLSENSPPGKILIEFKIFDADAEPEKKKYDKFNFKLSGEIAGNFQIQQVC
uniref:Cadherin domain-containing protein n=1 Tax=Panagrolaimus davidi TaxID=227884 RepID=A0A914PMW1_9BILA